MRGTLHRKNVPFHRGVIEPLSIHYRAVIVGDQFYRRIILDDKSCKFASILRINEGKSIYYLQISKIFCKFADAFGNTETHNLFDESESRSAYRYRRWSVEESRGSTGHRSG